MKELDVNILLAFFTMRTWSKWFSMPNLWKIYESM